MYDDDRDLDLDPDIIWLEVLAWHTSHRDHQIDLKIVLPADREPNV